MKPETHQAIIRSLKFRGGRSRPDKSFPFILPLLESTTGTCMQILDVGCGRGSAGIIINAEFGKRFWLAGVEINKEYIGQEARDFYDMLIIGDFTRIYKKDLGYDIYLFIDIIEHFEREEAIEIIKYLKGHKRPTCIIIASIPNAPKHWNQSPDFEKANPHEAHLYNWTNAEVERDLGLRLVGENDGVGVFAYGI